MHCRRPARLLTGTALAVAAAAALAAPSTSAFAAVSPGPAEAGSAEAGSAVTEVAAGPAVVPAITVAAGLPGDSPRPEALEVYPSTGVRGAMITVNTTACGPDGHGKGDTGSLGAGSFDLSVGTHKEVVVGQFTVPHSAQPGSYSIDVRCDDGALATGELTVKASGPSGHVNTGVGGSVGPDRVQVAAGFAVLAAAAGGGAWWLRRRSQGAGA
ncbi:hypothetical protein [Streptomyces sp. NPDC050504]|uniref:hypothetical protein n=1 Tax=Streptomyces sp. NPDC050504 TaxID=3365618 RepID=UPI0037A93DD2